MVDFQHAMIDGELGFHVALAKNVLRIGHVVTWIASIKKQHHVRLVNTALLDTERHVPVINLKVLAVGFTIVVRYARSFLCVLGDWKGG